jgi:acyl-homoserine lactone acylase PvdQ
MNRRLLLLPVLLAGCGRAEVVRDPDRYEATIVRDAFGVPHLLGASAPDVAYALGQAQCEDRLADVLYNLHLGVGRVSEFLGPAFVEGDKQARLFRHRERAEQDWPTLPVPLKEVVEAFVRGVNDWVRDHPRDLPAPVRDFTPVDVLAWHRHLLLQGGLAIARADGEGKGQGVPPGRSNAWAVSGARTVTGRPALLVDPHWPIDGNLALYEARLRGGELDAWGFMPVGTPLPAIGATGGVAWTFTAGGGDSADAFLLRLNPADPDEYEWDGKFKRMELHLETFRVREAGGFREVSERFRYTRHGPVLSNSRGEAFAAAIGGWGHARALEQFWRMSLARTAAEFKAALALDRISWFNVVWASADGRVGYVQTGEVPDRAAGHDWERPVPGWLPATLYGETLAFHKLPQIEDPLAGFIQNCNTSADAVAPGVKFRREDFPPGALYAHYGEYRARGQRATDLLSRTPKLDAESARRIAFDTYVLPADLWVPVLLAAVKEAGEPEDLREAAGLLRDWNRHADRDSAGATVFRFWRFACDAMAGSHAGRDSFNVSDTPEVRKDALQALRAAVADLRKRYGRVAVPWGEVKRLYRAGREWPLSGDGLGKLGMDTLRATAADTFDPEHKLVVSGGQSTMGLVFLGERPVIHAVVAYGQSGRHESPHYADQAPLYAEHRLRPVPWDEATLLAQAARERVVVGRR